MTFNDMMTADTQNISHRWQDKFNISLYSRGDRQVLADTEWYKDSWITLVPEI